MIKNLSDFDQSVYDHCRKIPRGRVSTYQEIARSIGRPLAARAVGNALGKNPYAPIVPCHRVVRSDGRIGGFASGSREKIKILEKEKVRIKDGKIVNFENALYKF